MLLTTNGSGKPGPFLIVPPSVAQVTVLAVLSPNVSRSCTLIFPSLSVAGQSFKVKVILPPIVNVWKLPLVKLTSCGATTVPPA